MYVVPFPWHVFSHDNCRPTYIVRTFVCISYISRTVITVKHSDFFSRADEISTNRFSWLITVIKRFVINTFVSQSSFDFNELSIRLRLHVVMVSWEVSWEVSWNVSWNIDKQNLFDNDVRNACRSFDNACRNFDKRCRRVLLLFLSELRHYWRTFACRCFMRLLVRLLMRFLMRLLQRADEALREINHGHHLNNRQAMFVTMIGYTSNLKLTVNGVAGSH